MTNTSTKTFAAYTVTERNNKDDIWHRIGSAWFNEKTESYTIQLGATPINGKIILMPPKADESTEQA